MWDYLNEMVEVPRWAFYASGSISVILALAWRDWRGRRKNNRRS